MNKQDGIKDAEAEALREPHISITVLSKKEALIEDIVSEIWYSGKNDSQVFDFHECGRRQKWVARLLSLMPNVEVAKREEGERIIGLLPQITRRFAHNKTCFDCVETIKLKALKGGKECLKH